MLCLEMYTNRFSGFITPLCYITNAKLLIRVLDVTVLFCFQLAHKILTNQSALASQYSVTRLQDNIYPGRHILTSVS